MKKRVMLFLVLLGLITGCDSGKKLECEFKDKNNNMEVKTVQKYTFDKNGKKVKEAKTSIEYTLSDQYMEYLKTSKINIEDAINVDAICNSYKNIDSSTCKSNIKDNVVKIEITIKTGKNKENTFDGNYDFFKEYYEGRNYECK